MVESASGDDDTFSFCDSNDFPGCGPPTPFQRAPALCASDHGGAGLAFASEGGSVGDLKYTAVFERGTDESMFKRERKAREGEREGDDVSCEGRGNGVGKAGEREGSWSCR